VADALRRPGTKADRFSLLSTGPILMSLSLEQVRVLVVDADLVFAHSIATALRTQGYGVRCVYNCEAAPSAAQEFKPHAMICEIVMPGMSGIALANEFARIQSNCKVLLVSGRDSVIEVMEDPTPGGDLRFLPKPVDLFEVFEFLAGCYQ
jgi:two-component system OmpR family response regulator